MKMHLDLLNSLIFSWILFLYNRAFSVMPEGIWGYLLDELPSMPLPACLLVEQQRVRKKALEIRMLIMRLNANLLFGVSSTFT